MIHDDVGTGSLSLPSPITIFYGFFSSCSIEYLLSDDASKSLCLSLCLHSFQVLSVWSLADEMSPPAASIDSGERRGDAVKGGPWPASLKPPSSASASSALVSGSLSITEPACIRWQPSSSSASAMSVVVSATSACTVKSSKRGKKPYAMLLGVRNEKHVFVFDIEAVRDSVVEAVKAVLAAVGGGAAGNVSEEVRASNVSFISSSSVHMCLSLSLSLSLCVCVCVCVCVLHVCFVSNSIHTA